MSLDSVKKSIYFYKTLPENSLFCTQGNDSENLKFMLNKRFPELTVYQSKDGKYNIEIKSFDSEHVFGMFCKQDENTNKFMRLKYVKDDTPQEIDAEQEKIILEYYSFFYIDISKKKTAFISNKQSGKFTDILNELLFEENYHINFIPYSIDSLEKAVGKFKRIKNIEATYCKKSSQEGFQKISEYHNENSLVIDSLKIILKVSSTGKQFVEDLKKIEEQKKKYEKYKIVGESDDGIEQVFDIIKRLFYRSAKIEIQGNPQKNIDFIKTRLKDELRLIYSEEKL